MIRIVTLSIAKCYDCGFSRILHPAEAERFKKWHEGVCAKVMRYNSDGTKIGRRRKVVK